MIRVCLLIFLLLSTLRVLCQGEASVNRGGKTDIYRAAEASDRVFLDSLYTVRTGTEYSYINGRDYFPYHYRSKNKPLLFHWKERKATITVNGRKFNNIVLYYDTYTDEVIFPEMENDFGGRVHQVSINRDVINTFELLFSDDTLRFRYFGENGSEQGLAPGFYEVAYDGPTAYLIRHRSVMHQRNGIAEYFYSPSGYVLTSTGYQKVSSNKNFLRLFGTRSPEIKRIIEQRDLNIRKASKREIISILKTYDDLSGVDGER